MITGKNPWSKATPLDKEFYQYLMDPDYMFKTHPISSGAYAIIGKMLHFNPTKRISLRDLRQAVLTLDTFSRSMGQCEHVVREHEHTTLPASVSSTTKLGTSQSQLESTIMAPEIDILDAASGPAARVAQDCSAGSAVDRSASIITSSSITAQSGYSASEFSSCSSSRTSSGASDGEFVTTPGGTTLITAITTGAAMMARTHHKVVRDDHGWQDAPISPAQMEIDQYDAPQAQYFQVIPVCQLYYVYPCSSPSPDL